MWLLILAIGAPALGSSAVRGSFSVSVLQTDGAIAVVGGLGEPWSGPGIGRTTVVRPGFRRSSEPAADPLVVRLLSPNGGEEFGTSDPVEVRWERRGGDGAAIDVDVTGDDGRTWISAGRDLPDVGSFRWTAPDQPRAEMRVRVRARAPGSLALDEGDGPFAVVDDDPPVLTLGMLPNPYLASVVDFFVVADEPLIVGSTSLVVGGRRLTPVQVDPGGRVFWFDHGLSAAGDSLAVIACGRDLRGNDGCLLGALATRPRMERESSLSSAAGGLRVSLGVGSTRPASSLHILEWNPDASRLAAGLTPAPNAPRYIVVADPGGEADLEFRLPAEAIGPDGAAVFGVVGPDGPMESWLDADRHVLTARSFTLGEFRLDADAKGSVRRVVEGQWTLDPVAPNPFRDRARIRLQLGAPENVTITVHDVAGRQVARLTDGAEMKPGAHLFQWDGLTAGRQTVPAGVYFLRVQAGARNEVVKFTRVR